VQPLTQDSNLVLTNSIVASNTNYLYQAYVGRVVLSNDLTIKVFLDDNAIRTGGNGTTLLGNTNRTWYDGVSYAKVEQFQIKNVTAAAGSSSVTLTWNSPLPQFSLSTPSYTVQRKNSLTDADWMTLATGLQSAGATTSYTDTSATNNAAFYRIVSP
jgi:hypothetical protein